MPTPTTIGASDVSLQAQANSVQRTYQRKSFFALGRHWVFYVRNGGIIPVLCYKTSVGNTEVWSSENAIAPMNDGAELSLWLQEVSPTVAYVHFVYADATGPAPLYYLRGLLVADGNIIPDPVQTVVPLEAGFEYENLGICIGFGDSPQIYVVYNKVTIADVNVTTPWLTISSTIDGTWTNVVGFPLELSAVERASWVPVVAPYGTECIVVYSFNGGSIYSRLLSSGVLLAEIDTLFWMGADAQKISIVSERYRTSAQQAFNSRAVYVAFQAINWDLHCIKYESLAWQVGPAAIIQGIDNFRQANPMLSIRYTGDEDPTVDDHIPATLYCFWTPTTASPLSEWVTYRVSRDLGDTWTNEAGADAAVSWIDEGGPGFEVQQSGSAFFHSSSDYDMGRSYIGIAWVIHTMPASLRFAALGFEDPDEDLPAKFIVRQPTADVELPGEFVVRHSSDGDTEGMLLAEFVVRHNSPDDPAPDLFAKFSIGEGDADLLGEFIVQQAASRELLGELIILQTGDLDFFGEFIVGGQDSEELLAEFESGQGSQDLLGEFVAGQWKEELLGKFIVQQAADVDLPGKFVIRRDGDVELLGEFNIRRSASQELLGEFIVQQAADVDLLGEFIVRRSASVELLGEFVIRRSDAENLLGEFNISRDEWISQGLNISVYRDLGVVS